MTTRKAKATATNLTQRPRRQGAKAATAWLLALAVVALAFRCDVACAQKEKGAWVFAYFKEPGNQGIYLALSKDGYHYTELNGGQPWVTPRDARENPKQGEIMRDVFLTRGPDAKFHMVWTWNWTGNSLGYAESPDLMTWGEQKQVPIMKDFADVNNVWAPEIYWDAAAKKWLVIWSSSMKGSAVGNRIWSSMTADFESFTKPSVFFDPGYVVIDATMFHEDGGPYRMVFKEQTSDPLTYNERVATGPTLEGPWNDISGFINESWSEGPSVIHVGDEYIVFYDHYRAPRARFEAVATKDWKHWRDIDDEISLPAYCKHGSFMHVTDAEAERLMQRRDAVAK